jgi:hypothetical protein
MRALEWKSDAGRRAARLGRSAAIEAIILFSVR